MRTLIDHKIGIHKSVVEIIEKLPDGEPYITVGMHMETGKWHGMEMCNRKLTGMKDRRMTVRTDKSGWPDSTTALAEFAAIPGLEHIQQIAMTEPLDKPPASTRSFMSILENMSNYHITRYLAELEKSGQLAKKLEGTHYRLEDGSVAAFTLAMDLGLM